VLFAVAELLGFVSTGKAHRHTQTDRETPPKAIHASLTIA